MSGRGRGVVCRDPIPGVRPSTKRPSTCIATGGNRQRVPPDPGPSCASLFAIIEVGGVSEVAEVLGFGERLRDEHIESALPS
jgi:hypothetical protein